MAGVGPHGGEERGGKGKSEGKREGEGRKWAKSQWKVARDRKWGLVR